MSISSTGSSHQTGSSLSLKRDYFSILLHLSRIEAILDFRFGLSHGTWRVWRLSPPKPSSTLSSTSRQITCVCMRILPMQRVQCHQPLLLDGRGKKHNGLAINSTSTFFCPDNSAI